MRLIYKETGKPVEIGDIIPMVDEDERTALRVEHFDKPHKPSSSGKVSVTVMYDANEPQPDQHWREYYVSVIGAEWIEREDQLEYQANNSCVSFDYPKPAAEKENWCLPLDTAELAEMLLKDMKLLESEDWTPDAESIEAHCEVIKELHRRAIKGEKK